MPNVNVLKTALLSVLLLSTPAAASQDTPTQNTSGQNTSGQDWAAQGAQAVAHAQQLQPNRNRARNVILFVGDGMGISTVTAARILAGQKRGQSGEENSLSFERFDHVALSKTYNTNQQTADSAGTMTAMMTGVKTKAGFISVPDDRLRGECLPKAAQLPTFLELAERAGKSTGVVTTAAITHATPAATYAHTSERNWQADSTMPAAAIKKGCRDIAQQLINFKLGDGIDVMLGGGRRDFLPASVRDGEGQMGRRADGQNLIEQWLAHSGDRRYITNQRQFNRLKTSSTEQVLGLFNSNHLQYEVDRANDVGGEPSLAEMTQFAITKLHARSAKTGYFLMVEAGRIDHGHHYGNAYRALEDTIALADAVEAAVAAVDLTDTLIIVTADHSHVLTMAGYPTRGNPILGYVHNNQADGTPSAQPATDAAGQRYTTLSYANGLGATAAAAGQGEHVHPQARDYQQTATYPLASETHGGEDVAIYATGAGAYMVHGVQEQTVIFHVMKAATGL